MANIYFGVGSIGSGTAEMFGYLAQINRDRTAMPEFRYPSKIANGIGYIWASLNNAPDGIAEAKYMMENNLSFEYNAFLTALRVEIINNSDANDLYIGGAGVTLFINELLRDFPEATVFFTERVNAGDDMTALKVRSESQNYDLTPELEAYLANLNAQLSAKTEETVKQIDYQWTIGNTRVLSQGFALGTNPRNEQAVANNAINDFEKQVHQTVIFLYPTKVAVYKPSIVVNFL